MRTLAGSLGWLLLGATLASGAEAPTFNAHIRPLFQAYCTECHGEEAKPKGGLDLRLRRFAVKGGESGAAVVAGKPDESLLIERIVSGDMPPGKKKLSPAEIDLLKRWIAAGAKVETDEPETLASGFRITEEDRRYWAFQPVRRPEPPAIAAATTIDRFLLAELTKRQLTFNPAAERAALIRRVTFDLHGLPPTPEEVAAFVEDSSADAFEKVVERLLASSRYGERWGRHWLDVAGYADSEGGGPQDPVRADAWKFRDYVIRSFNADKPFDQFIREQLAGDELAKQPYDPGDRASVEQLTATGFLRLTADGTGAPGVDQKLARNQVLTDTVKVVSSAFLGMTLGCAECHNHRYDPIPQTDFYRLRAFLEPAYNTAAWKAPAARQVALMSAADRQKGEAIEVEAKKLDAARTAKQNQYIDATFDKQVAKLPEAMRDLAREARKTPEAKRNAIQKKLIQENPSLNVSPGSLYLYDSKAAEDLKKMAAQAAALRDTKPKAETVRALTELPGKMPTTFLFHRGDPDQPKQAVPPAGLQILEATLPLAVPAKPLPSGSSGRRLALANWLTDPKHPLTARVLVNRIWMLHFGKGLVGTPGDFGRLGERPTHPELLDWLASEFVAKGWSVKALHRQILRSAAYRQSSARTQRDTNDADGRYLSRYPLRRLDAEAVRDAMLAVSGSLSEKRFGPPVPVKENESGLFVLDAKAPEEEFRRSIYVQVRRSQPLAVLDTFDWATMEPNCEFRNVSTSTPQALLMLNGEFAIQQADRFADRVAKQAGSDPNARVESAWKLAFGAAPTESQRTDGVKFLKDRTAAFQKDKNAERRALALFCQALLASNRFLYVD